MTSYADLPMIHDMPGTPGRMQAVRRPRPGHAPRSGRRGSALPLMLALLGVSLGWALSHLFG